MVNRSLSLDDLASVPASAASFKITGIWRYTALALLCTLAGFVAVSNVLLNVRQPAIPLEIGIPERYMPGNTLPYEAHCEDTLPPGYLLFCAVRRATNTVHMAFDMRRGTITSVSRGVEGLVLGDFVHAWGTPTGHRHVGSISFVYWGNRSVYAVGKPVTPYSQVRFVYIHAEERSARPWDGFTARR